MYLLFESTSISSGDFVFKIWYNKVQGRGRSQPRTVDYPPGWIDPTSPEYEASLNPKPANETDDALTDGTNSTETNGTSDSNSTVEANATAELEACW